MTVSPVSVFAGLKDPVAVAPLRVGSVSVIISTTLGGSCSADRPLIVEVDLDPGIRQEILDLAFEQVAGQVELLVILLVHEHENCRRRCTDIPSPFLRRTPAPFSRRYGTADCSCARLDVLHLDLHEGAAAAAYVHVVGLEHAPYALIPFDQVAGANFGCEDFCHGKDGPDLEEREILPEAQRHASQRSIGLGMPAVVRDAAQFGSLAV